MGRNLLGMVALTLFFPSLLLAQRAWDEEGFELGSVWIRPVAEVLGAYDDRVTPVSGDIDADLYSELSAALYLENNPALFDFFGSASYGYRFYREYTDLDSDFYRAGLSVASTDSPLKLGLSSYLRKTLDYDTVYDASSGYEPGVILTGDPSTWYTTEANIAYEKNLTDKTSITPGYDIWHYYQDFERGTNTEWVVQRASLQMGYEYTARTRIFLTGYYSLQTNGDEDGTIGGLMVGVEGSYSDKTRWEAHIGAAAADYELSGADQGVVGRVEATWEPSEKLSAYIFGASDFEPGYEGGDARRVYRLGYGAIWNIVSRWLVMTQILHDYDQELGDAVASDEEVKNFLTARTEYDLTPHLSVGAGIRYIMDEQESDQTIVTLNAVYRY